MPDGEEHLFPGAVRGFGWSTLPDPQSLLPESDRAVDEALGLGGTERGAPAPPNRLVRPEVRPGGYEPARRC